MTIMAAEAAPEAAEAAEGAVASRGASAARRSPSARPAARPRPAAAMATPAPPPAQQRRPAGDGAQRARRQTRRSFEVAKAGPRGGSYHNAIKAEFLIAILVIVITPIVSPGSASSKGGTGPSPYGRGDLVRMAAVVVVFFTLSLMSSGRPGKFAAMFGALVDLGVVYQASKAGVFKGAAGLFSKSQSTLPSGGGGTAGPGGTTVA